MDLEDQTGEEDKTDENASVDNSGGITGVCGRARKLLGPIRMWWVWLLPLEVLHARVPFDDHLPRHSQ